MEIWINDISVASNKQPCHRTLLRQVDTKKNNERKKKQVWVQIAVA